MTPMKRTRTATASVGCCGPMTAAPLDEAEAVELARTFGALADPARLRILSLIASQPTGEVCACDLVEPVGRSQPTVSHHLKVLRDAGLVDATKRGTWVWYRLVPEGLTPLRALLETGPPRAGNMSERGASGAGAARRLGRREREA